MKSDSNRYITSSQASRIIGITRQSVSGLKKSGTYNFFVEVDGKPRVDTNSQDWKSYLHEIEIKKQSKATRKINKPSTKNNKTTEKQIETEQVVKRKKLKNVELDKDSAIGFSVNDFEIKNLPDLKRVAEIKKIDLDMMIKLSQVVHKELVVGIISELSQNIQQFVDLPRKVSDDICLKLERDGMQKEVEKLLAPAIQKMIQDFKKTAKKITRLKNE